MKSVDPILTGQYLRSETRQAPPKELMQAVGAPIAPEAEMQEIEQAKAVEEGNG
ncbi:MAG: NADH-quinone oxidoreductase subunit B, partial [Cyanobacteria bacterium P01_D01_bin.128]